MAANKFATTLHRNTNKITLILVYAVLEWVLISLLLINSLFSYLIIKYTEYFGLKRPCLWCSRLDHIFDPSKSKNSYRDLVCDDHANEISKLGFCSHHRKLSKSQDMCEDCSSSSDFDLFPWINQIENGDVNFRCSCCGVSLERKKVYSPYLLMNPPWEVSDNTQKENSVEEDGVDNKIHDHHHDHDQDRSEFVPTQNEDTLKMFDEKIERELCGTEKNSCSVCDSEDDDKVEEISEKEEEEEDLIKKDYDLISSMETQIQCCEESKDGDNKRIESTEAVAKHLEFYIDGDDCHLIPIESGYKFRVKDEEHFGNEEDVILDFGFNDNGNEVELVMVEKKSNCNSEETVGLLSAQENEKETKIEDDSEQVNESDWSSFLQAEVGTSMEAEQEENEENENEKVTEMPLIDSHDEFQATRDMDFNVHQASEDGIQMQSDENDAEISIGTEIPDHENMDDDIQTGEIISSHLISQEDHFTCSSSEFRVHDHHHGSMKTEEDNVEPQGTSAETGEEQMMMNHLTSISDHLNEIEEEKVPDTATSFDKKMLLLERRELTTEETFDGGSVLSDTDVGGDGVSTVEKLKATLKAERKALNDLYAELEEERSASAVAASQTMAMINRLQEEKSAMQMEALQYQRMMEEQSEYDQEALQILNELMVKREKEKVELEKELEVCRKRVHEYEVKEKMAIMLRRKSRNSSGSYSVAEDSDGVSIDLNSEAKEDDKFENNEEGISQNTPVDAVLYLEESLGIFEEERLSILEQLKVLEEKLFTLNEEEEEEEEEHHFENGNGVALTNGNGKHHHERKIKAKRLLPLFDAETEDGVLYGNEIESDSVASHNSSVIKFELDDNKRVELEEEVDHVYERLQALEADREFLKHCLTSLRKGDKGVHLLQEILRHLRDLRNIELRAREMTDAAAL